MPSIKGQQYKKIAQGDSASIVKSAEYQNAPRTGLEEVTKFLESNLPTTNPNGFASFVGGVATIVAKGPNQEDDFTDENYWCQIEKPLITSNGATVTFTKELLENPQGIHKIMNISEISDHSHRLKVGQKVFFFMPWSVGGYSAATAFALLMAQSIKEIILVKITANAAIMGSNTSWDYTVMDEAGTTYTGVRNSKEPCEGTPGPLGIHVDASGYLTGSGCRIQPIGNTVAGYFPMYLVKGENRYYFDTPNSAEVPM